MGTMKSIIVSLAAVLVGACGSAEKSVNAFVVYDDGTMGCRKVSKLMAAYSERDPMYRAARSKLNWCEAGDGGDGPIVGYFDSDNKAYEFRRPSAESASEMRRLCLDVATANFVVDTPSGELVFETQVGLDGTTETFACDYFGWEMSKRGLTILVAPAHQPILIDIDPVLVLATGANPQLEGVPHRYYDEVRDILRTVIDDKGK